MASAADRGGDRPVEPLGVPSLLVAVMVAAALVVGAVIVVAVSGSAAVRAAAVALLGIAGIALMVYLYAMLSRTGVAPDRGAAPVLPLGAGVGGARLRSATVTALRDAHSLQRGTRHFAEAAASMIRAHGDRGQAGAGLIELFEAQRECAAQQADLLEERLHALGHSASHSADDEAIVAASLYELLLVRSVATNARHARGLVALGAATYTLIEHLAATAGDASTRSLGERCRRELEPLAERWSASWDAVLDLDAKAANGDVHHAMLGLLEEAHDMEAMHASLLDVSVAQARGAGIAPGAEDAGLAHLVALVDQERSTAAHDRDLLHERLRALHHHPSRLHAFETLVAARATALGAHIRGYKLIRDIRDLLAASQLATASYELLARAAERDGDQETASLAQRLRAKDHTAAERLTAELDSALEIALLAE